MPDQITRIIGVLDWEMCTIGDSLADLGTTLAYWVDATDPEELQQKTWGPTAIPGSFRRSEVVEYYARKTGSDVSQVSYYLTFARFKLAVIVQQIYFRYHQGITKDERFASMPGTVHALLKSAWDCAQLAAFKPWSCNIRPRQFHPRHFHLLFSNYSPRKHRLPLVFDRSAAQ